MVTVCIDMGITIIMVNSNQLISDKLGIVTMPKFG